jgi:hypothetical protein
MIVHSSVGMFIQEAVASTCKLSATSESSQLWNSAWRIEKVIFTKYTQQRYEDEMYTRNSSSL